jgi:TolB-like protein/tRNA A-37 threonylcarbamoyl transferase component Bud32
VPDLRDQLETSLGDAYTIERELGGGGMSRVFLAVERRFHRQVVIKVLAPSVAETISADRFQREIAVAAALQDPYIVPLLTAGEASGLPYYTMPFARGESLRHRIDAGSVNAAQALSILRDVARALSFAHSRGVVHRDIKPENVLLSGETAVVTDFGIAKAIQASRTHATASGWDAAALTTAGTSLGTPAYMSPEQAAGDDVDHRADIYSWGVVAYELLSGAHPFAGKTTSQQLIAAHVSETPRPLRGAPPVLAALVMRALEKDPAKRPQSADELVQRLGSIGAWGAPRRGALLVGVGIIAAIAIGGIAAWRARASATAANEITRIAVMPLENAGRDTATDYLANGMSDALIQELSRSPRLSVVTRRSAARFRDRSATPQEIGKALGISSFLEGAVQRSGGRLRVAARLVSTKDGGVLWSNSYDRSTADVFAVQDDISRAIAGALRVALGDRASSSSTQRPTGARAEAYDLSLLARHQAERFDSVGFYSAMATYQRAIAFDSTYAVPWAGLASVWLNLSDDFIAPREGYPRAESAARRAVDLDSTLSQAYSVQAWVRAAYRYDLHGAMRLAEQALQHNPGDSDALEVLGLALSFSSQTDSAIAVFARARSVDPLNPQLASDASRALLLAGRYDDALTAGRAALAIDPQYGLAHFFIGQTLLMQGKPSAALAAFQRTGSVRDRGLGGMAAAYSALGRPRDARAVLDTMLAESKRRYVRPEFLAWVHLSIGENERALTLLEQAYVDRAGGMVYLPVDPRWASLRGDPRFERLVRDIRGR